MTYYSLYMYARHQITFDLLIARTQILLLQITSFKINFSLIYRSNQSRYPVIIVDFSQYILIFNTINTIMKSISSKGIIFLFVGFGCFLLMNSVVSLPLPDQTGSYYNCKKVHFIFGGMNNLNEMFEICNINNLK